MNDPLADLDIVLRLRTRASIRRSISKSVQEGEPDRISDLLEQAADEIVKLRNPKPFWKFWK